MLFFDTQNNMHMLDALVESNLTEWIVDTRACRSFGTLQLTPIKTVVGAQ